MGIVDINWRKVETEALKVIDQDGDKKFDQKDLSILWNKLKKVLLYQLPSSGESQDRHMKAVHATFVIAIRESSYCFHHECLLYRWFSRRLQCGLLPGLTCEADS
jgi:hypothetical protein